MDALIRHRQGCSLVIEAVTCGLLAACAGGTLPPPEEGTTDVTMSGNSFNPSTVTIQRGERVRWVNTDAFLPHTSTSGDPQEPDAGDVWDSPSVGPGGTFVRPFDEVGEFEYYCRFHWQSGMRNAMVIVVEAQ